jgi:DNA-binding beta-propeller fold protein YncE
MISRRHTLTMLPMVAAVGTFASGPVKAAAAQQLAFVMNSGDGSISVIDMRSRTVVQTAPTYREPSHWALTKDHTKLLISDAGGNGLFAFDPSTGAALGRKTMADPYQIGFTPDYRYLAVNALRIDFVDFYDANTLELVKRLKLGRWPSHLGFSPDGRVSFHSMQKSNTLVAVDLTTFQPLWTTKVGPTPAGVLWLNGQVLVCIMDEHYMVVVDPKTGEIARKVITGTGPHNAFLSPDRSALYVTNRIGGTLALLDPDTFEIKRVYQLPGGPDDIGIAPDGKLWVVLRFAEAVAVLDPGTGDVERIDVGRSPHGIFLNTEMAPGHPVTAEIL